MAAYKRLQRDLEDIGNSSLTLFRDIQADEDNFFLWQGLFVPEDPPYDKGAFKIEINFPVAYPFEPPEITFKTRIYHPNVDENGKVSFELICLYGHSWKPSIKMRQGLADLFKEPDGPHSRMEIWKEYQNNRKTFMENAERFTKEHSEPRPVD